MADTVYYGSSKFEKPLEGTDGGQAVKRFVLTVDTDDFTTAGTSQAVDVSAGFPANAYVLSGHVELLETLSGGAVSAATVQLGDTADPDELLTSTNVFTGQALGRKWSPGAFTFGTLESGYSPELLVSTTDGNVDDLTTGVVKVIIDYWLPDAL